MAVNRETQGEEALGGEPDVEIAGADVERKTGDGDGDHQRSDGPEGAKIVANESVVNQEAGDVRLRETNGRGEQPQGRDERKPSPVRRNERKRTPILSEQDVRGIRRHGSPQDSSRGGVSRRGSGGISMVRASVGVGQRENRIRGGSVAHEEPAVGGWIALLVQGVRRPEALRAVLVGGKPG